MFNSVAISNMTVTEKSTPNDSSPSENGPRHLENAPKDSKTLVVCFCVAILGSQLVLIYNVSILSGEINRFDTWMKHFNEELVVLSSSLTSGWSSIESRLKTKEDVEPKDALSKLRVDFPGVKTLLKDKRFEDALKRNFSCNITDPEVLYAIARAKTEVCKEELADIVCQDKAGKLMPETIPRYCPLKGSNHKGQYLGCFKDSFAKRDVGNWVTTLRESNSPEKCVEICINGGYSCAALQFSVECWCGNYYGRYGSLPESACSLSCPGNRSQSCGGYSAIRVFSTGLLEMKRFRDVKLEHPPQELMQMKPVRIVFAVMVAGRAVRQVKRLIKAIYHPDHYVFIHVDKKAEYMYQELLALEAILPNLRLAKERITVGWSGFTQMQAAYSMMKALVDMKDWAWDYFINLSECAYPIKPTDVLAKFLRKYQGANFIKSHEVETFSFVDKQGLGFLFHECEDHLWRLGPKHKVPSGIMYDGGSDWFGLHRSFCTYAVKANDSLINGLTKWAKYSFAPLESYFHILLQNSEFCDTQIDINLHMINWVGSQGCTCVRRKVDFCGCSPRNLRPKDFERIMSHMNHPVFFARKLEAPINQEIYNLIDMKLGKAHSEDAKLSLYWQSHYSPYDKPSPQTDLITTFGNSLVRLASEDFERNTQQCVFMDLKLIETHVLFEDDKFQSYLVKHSLTLPDDTACLYESRFSKINRFKIENTSASNGRIQTLAVGSEFDSKERLFRNYPGFMGPDTQVVLHHAWVYGPTRKVTFSWVDPIGNVAASHDIRIPRTRLVQFHNPKLKGPLKPGIWTVKVSVGRTQIARVYFAIVPVAIAQTDQSCNDDVQRGKEKQESLTDKLTSYFWKSEDICLISVKNEECPAFKPCKETEWSSVSPDPKSDIKENDGLADNIPGIDAPPPESVYWSRKQNPNANRG